MLLETASHPAAVLEAFISLFLLGDLGNRSPPPVVTQNSKSSYECVFVSLNPRDFLEV